MGVLISMIVSQTCFEGKLDTFNNYFFGEQFIAALLVLISYVMVSLILNLLWFASQNDNPYTKLSKNVAIVLSIVIVMHFGFIAILFYLKLNQPWSHSMLEMSSNTSHHQILTFMVV